MKFKNILESILLESKMSEKVIQKLKNLGVNDYNAEALGNIAGSIYRLLAFRILEKYEQEAGYEISKDVKERFALVNGSNAFVRERNKVRSIVDWYRVGLGGVIKPYEGLSFDQLYEESEKWHESLGVGESKIDYIENHDIIIDFRKEDGEGYYWVNLGKQSCPEEAERMGHCGSSRGNLYSLRSYKKIQNNHTLNKSHLTASVSDYGDLLQLKGPKNSKPTTESHQFILPLFYFKDGYGEFLINGIGYEYDSSNDFKFSDLTEDQIKKFYSDRPELFSGRQEKKLLRNMGLIDSQKFDLKFTLQFAVKDIEDYIRGEYVHVAERVLSGDTYDFWDNSEYVDWKYAVQHELNNENTQKIRELLKVDSSMDLVDAIEEHDEDDEVKNRIRWSMNDAESHDYENHLYSELKDTLGEYGRVIEMHDGGVSIEVDLEYLISKNKIDDEDIDEISERCGGDSDALCLFSELLGDGFIEKPRYDLDDRWYPSADTNDFNEILSDRLNEI